MTRHLESGYALVAMNDPQGRRGIWYRQEGLGASIDICGGREGDDAYVRIEVGQVITDRDIFAIADILNRGASMIRESAEQAERDAREKASLDPAASSR